MIQYGLMCLTFYAIVFFIHGFLLSCIDNSFVSTLLYPILMVCIFAFSNSSKLQNILVSKYEVKLFSNCGLNTSDEMKSIRKRCFYYAIIYNIIYTFSLMVIYDDKHYFTYMCSGISLLLGSLISPDSVVDNNLNKIKQDIKSKCSNYYRRNKIELIIFITLNIASISNMMFNKIPIDDNLYLGDFWALEIVLLIGCIEFIIIYLYQKDVFGVLISTAMLFLPLYFFIKSQYQKGYLTVIAIFFVLLLKEKRSKQHNE